MSNIQPQIDAIRKAKKGREVRESIASGLEAMNVQSNNAESAAITAQNSAVNSAERAETAESGAQSSAEAAASSEGVAVASAEAAEAAKTAAETAQGIAETAASNAKDSEDAAATSADSASTSASTAAGAQTAAETAQGKAEDAQSAAEAAQTAAEDAQTTTEEARDAAIASSTLSRSWAAGGTGTRAGEDTDNAKYYAEQAKSAAAGGLIPMGSVTWAQFKTLQPTASTGAMYHIKEEFYIDDTFEDYDPDNNENNLRPDGAEVYLSANGTWETTSGRNVTGVRLEGEELYQHGHVEIPRMTADKFGVGKVDNTTIKANNGVISADYKGMAFIASVENRTLNDAVYDNWGALVEGVPCFINGKNILGTPISGNNDVTIQVIIKDKANNDWRAIVFNNNGQDFYTIRHYSNGTYSYWYSSNGYAVANDWAANTYYDKNVFAFSHGTASNLWKCLGSHTSTEGEMPGSPSISSLWQETNIANELFNIYRELTPVPFDLIFTPEGERYYDTGRVRSKNNWCIGNMFIVSFEAILKEDIGAWASNGHIRLPFPILYNTIGVISTNDGKSATFTILDNGNFNIQNAGALSTNNFFNAFAFGRMK